MIKDAKNQFSFNGGLPNQTFTGNSSLQKQTTDNQSFRERRLRRRRKSGIDSSQEASNSPKAQFLLHHIKGTKFGLDLLRDAGDKTNSASTGKQTLTGSDQSQSNYKLSKLAQSFLINGNKAGQSISESLDEDQDETPQNSVSTNHDEISGTCLYSNSADSIQEDQRTVFSGSSAATHKEEGASVTGSSSQIGLKKSQLSFNSSEADDKEHAELLMKFVNNQKAIESEDFVGSSLKVVKNIDELNPIANGVKLHSNHANKSQDELVLFSEYWNGSDDIPCQKCSRHNSMFGEPSLNDFKNIDEENPKFDGISPQSIAFHHNDINQVQQGATTYNLGQFNNLSRSAQNGYRKVQEFLLKGVSFSNASDGDQTQKINNKRKFNPESDEEDSKLIDQIPMQRAVSYQDNELRKEDIRQNLPIRGRSNTVNDSSSKSSLYSYLKKYDKNKIDILESKGINKDRIDRLQYPVKLCENIDSKGFDDAIREYILAHLPKFEFQYEDKFLNIIMQDRHFIFLLQIPTTKLRNTEAKIKRFMETYIQNLQNEKIHHYVRPYLHDLSFKDVAEHFANDQQFKEKWPINL